MGPTTAPLRGRSESPPMNRSMSPTFCDMKSTVSRNLSSWLVYFSYLVNTAERLDHVFVDGVVELGEGGDGGEPARAPDVGVGGQAMVSAAVDDGG